MYRVCVCLCVYHDRNFSCTQCNCNHSFPSIWKIYRLILDVLSKVYSNYNIICFDCSEKSKQILCVAVDIYITQHNSICFCVFVLLRVKSRAREEKIKLNQFVRDVNTKYPTSSYIFNREYVMQTV